MITKSIYKFTRACLLCCNLVAALTACTDTWDDHYEGAIDGVNEGSLWQAIKQDASLSNFASVIEATGYDKSLGSSQVFTVFAPTNDSFTASEAAALIAQYKEEKQEVNDDDNSVIKEFVQNHIALYNHSVATTGSDSIVMMNKKYAVLGSSGINNSSFAAKNMHYENGILFVVDKPIDYSANIFEYLRKDADLDSVRSFLYNSKFYYKDFVASSSVEGGLDSLGRTVYLDSVFSQRNELYSYVGRIASEDSTYWMVLPTNDTWKELVDEYSQYFVYDKSAASSLEKGDVDSLAYTNTRLAILQGTAFSQTTNYSVVSGQKQTTTADDSVKAYPYDDIDYNYRRYYWGANFNYYQYFDPLSEGGVFFGSERVPCSNGTVLKTANWNIDKLQTFNRWIILEAEASGTIKEVGKSTNDVDQCTPVSRTVQNDNFTSRLWNDRYVEFQPNVTTTYGITFNITGVLSNMGYDIFVVTAPALANDSNATSDQCLPTRLRFTLNHPGLNRALVMKSNTSDMHGVIVSDADGFFNTTGSNVDYLLLAENYKFPAATYGLNESEPSITLLLENRTLNSQVTQKTHQRTTAVDCILLVPHGTLQLIDDLQEFVSTASGPGVLMMPHGLNKWQYFRLR